MDKIFAKNPKNLILGTFKSSKLSPLNVFAKIGICHFSHFMMWNFMEKKEKTDGPEILHPRQMGKGMKPN